MEPDVPRRLLIVVSAPSGAGKTTLCDRLLKERDDMVYSVSCTTRKPRGQERDGADYFFLTEHEFLERVEQGMFLEYAQVHGHWYGTLKSTVTDSMAAGKSVLMDIDVQGAAQIRDYVVTLPDGDPLRAGFVDIFVEPPSIQALRDRLTARAEDAREEIERRVLQAESEMRSKQLYKYRIVNDSIERAYEELLGVIMTSLRGGETA